MGARTLAAFAAGAIAIAGAQEEVVAPAEPLPSRVVFVVDASGSMKAGSLAKAIAFVKSVLESPFDEFEFAIVTFSESTRVREWEEATPEAVSEAVEWVRTGGADGSTYLAPAMKRARDLEPQAVVLVTDGRFTDATEAVEATRDYPVPIWGLVIGSCTEHLAAIAAATGGGCYRKRVFRPPPQPH